MKCGFRNAEYLGEYAVVSERGNKQTISTMPPSFVDEQWMHLALELAAKSRGFVEPNPMVGCVIVQGDQVVGQGFHQKFGGPHAEIKALNDAGDAAEGSDVYVTLEPCCHQGKTGPCTQALVDAKVSRVLVGCKDPNPQVAGQGIAALRAAGIDVLVGIQEESAQQLIAPFTKLMTTSRPWVIAKWAMTLDGKIASRTGSSQWISGEESRQLVHKLRGQVDGVLVGRGTAEFDDPLLTARPPGPRIATRIVLDSNASLSVDSQLVRTIADAPLLVAASARAPAANCERLQSLGADVLQLDGDSPADRLNSLLDELGKRQMTNLLVEGGSEVLGTMFDANAIDEVHVFIAPKLVGGAAAASPIGGNGIADMVQALQLTRVEASPIGCDIHIHGFLQ